MKRKALCFVLALFAIAIFSLGCGGGGGGSNPASSNLAGRARVSGVVYDSSNKPVPNAHVSLVLASEALVNSLTDKTNGSSRYAKNGNETEFNTTTDNKGQYTFNNVPYGEYTLSAITANGAQIVTNVAVRADTVTPNEIILKPFGSISGKVSKSGSSQSDGIVVSLVNTSYCTITGSDGSFTLTNVPSDTEYTISAMASGYETATKKVKIVATDSLELKSVALSLSPITRTGYTIKALLETAYSPVTVFAISDDGKYSYAGQLDNGVCNLIITNPGTYNVIPAYLADGNNFAGSISIVPVSEEQIRKGQSEDVELTMGTIPSGSTKYAVLKGKIDNSSSSDSSFGVSLFGANGNEFKKSVAGNTLFEINSIPEGKYSVVVFSENSLQVLCDVDMKKGEITDLTDKIKPIKLNPTITNEENSGIATITFQCKGIISSVDTGSSFDGSNKLFFSVKAKGIDSKYVTLSNVSSNGVSKSSFDAYSENDKIEQAFSVDNLREKDTLGELVFSFNNGLNQPVFETSYIVNGGNPKYKKVTLGTLTQSEDIILFKAFELEGQVCYLVVTSTKAYVFKNDGSQAIAPVDFSTVPNITNIKYGNACYFTTSGKPSLAFQFVGAPDTNDNPTGLQIYSAVYNSGSFNPTPILVTTTGTTPTYDPNSANKLLVSSDGKYYSVCDNYILIYDPSNSTWKKVGFGPYMETADGGTEVTESDYKTSKNEYTLASFSTIVSDLDNQYHIFYLNQADACGAYKIYLETSLLNNNTYSATPGVKYKLIDSLSMNDSDFDTKVIHHDGNKWYGQSNLISSSFPLTLNDCLDNPDAINKVFVNQGYSWSEPENLDPVYVFSETIYSGSGTNVKSSYINPGKSLPFPFDAWIEREPSNVQNLVLRNMRNYREQKISIKQVFNSSAYLEGSIGYTTINGNQIHVLYADDSSIKVLVLNCIESNN